MQSTAPQIINWLSAHVALVGWPALISIVFRYSWKASAAFTEFFNKANTVYNKSLDMNANVEKIMSNHLPHTEGALHEVNNSVKQVDENITGLRQDFRAYFIQNSSRKKG